MKKAFTLAVALIAAICFCNAQTEKLILHFGTNQSALDEAETARLNEWAASHTAGQASMLKLSGYCDARSTEAFNDELSQARCASIKNRLEQFGYNNCSIISYGESQPLCTDDNEDCWALNRRVEVVYNSQPDRMWISDYFDAKEKQIFFVSTTKSGNIVGNEGTQLEFPAFCFVHSDGSKVKSDSVRVELREFYNCADMILNGLSTSTPDGLIQTSGSIELRVFDRDKELKLANCKYVSAIFNGRKPNDGFTAFSGLIEQTDKPLLMQSTMSSTYAVPQGAIVWQEQEIDEYKFIFRDVNVYNDPKLRAWANKEAREYTNKHLKYVLTTKDNVNDRVPASALDYKEGAIEMNDLKYSMLFMQHSCYYYYKNTISVKKDTTNIYTMSNQLGWINCDKWLDAGIPLVNQPLETREDSTFYFLVFNRLNCALHLYNFENGQCGFPAIPKDEPATLVAINVKNGEYSLGTKAIMCSNDAVSVDFTPTPKDDIVATLNSSFWRVAAN